VSSPILMFCAPGHIFGGTRGHRVSFSCFSIPGTFSTIWRALGLDFMFCAPELVFGSTEGVVSRFLVFHAQTHFRRYRGRRVMFSRCALPDSFSAVPRASGSIFVFCAPELVFGGSEVNVYCFLSLRTRTRLRWSRGRRVPFSCFALPDSF
jgi:hypothetical protein